MKVEYRVFSNDKYVLPEKMTEAAYDDLKQKMRSIKETAAIYKLKIEIEPNELGKYYLEGIDTDKDEKAIKVGQEIQFRLQKLCNKYNLRVIMKALEEELKNEEHNYDEFDLEDEDELEDEEEYAEEEEQEDEIDLNGKNIRELKRQIHEIVDEIYSLDGFETVKETDAGYEINYEENKQNENKAKKINDRTYELITTYGLGNVRKYMSEEMDRRAVENQMASTDRQNKSEAARDLSNKSKYTRTKTPESQQFESKVEELAQKIEESAQNLEKEKNPLKKYSLIFKTKQLLNKMEKEIKLQKIQEKYKEKSDALKDKRESNKKSDRGRKAEVSMEIDDIEKRIRANKKYDIESTSFIYSKEEIEEAGGIENLIEELENSGNRRQEMVAEKINEIIELKEDLEEYNEELKELNNKEREYNKKQSELKHKTQALTIKTKFNVFEGIKNFFNNISSTVKEFRQEQKDIKKANERKRGAIQEIKNEYDFQREKIKKEYEEAIARTNAREAEEKQNAVEEVENNKSEIISGQNRAKTFRERLNQMKDGNDTKNNSEEQPSSERTESAEETEKRKTNIPSFLFREDNESDDWDRDDEYEYEDDDDEYEEDDDEYEEDEEGTLLDLVERANKRKKENTFRSSVEDPEAAKKVVQVGKKHAEEKDKVPSTKGKTPVGKKTTDYQGEEPGSN